MQYYANILITPHFFVFFPRSQPFFCFISFKCSWAILLLFTLTFSKECFFFCFPLLNHLTLTHALQEGCRTIPEDYLKNYEKAFLRNLRLQWLNQIVAFELIRIAQTQFFPYMLYFHICFESLNKSQHLFPVFLAKVYHCTKQRKRHSVWA